MSRLPNEDLFEGRKMSFGEHLEELRVALVRSLLGLAVGVVIGFLISKHVIRVVVAPLEEALQEYYIDHSAHKLAPEYGVEEDELREAIGSHGMVYQDFFIERTDLAAIVQGVGSTPISTVESVDVGSPEASGGSPDALEEASPGQGNGGDSVADAADAAATVAATDAILMPEFDFVRLRLWRDVSYRIQSISTTEPFLSWMKVGIISGLTIAAPWIFLQLWIFVAEGLYPTEKKYVYIYLPFSILLFVAGACMAYFFVFDPVLDFLLGFNKTMGAEPNLRISEWLSFFMLLPLGFGVGFQLPLVMLFMNRIGVMSVEAYLQHWRVAILIIFVAAMFLTPSDPQSMMLLAIPLTILYFVGIALCKFLPQRSSPFGEGYDPAN